MKPKALASDYSLFWNIEMEGHPVAQNSLKKEPHINALTPQPAQGLTEELK